MRILVLGATGQIGYALTQRLAQTDHHISVLVRDGRNLQFAPSVHVTQRSEFTPDALGAAIAGADHVVYAIGLPEQFSFDSEIFKRVNQALLTTFLSELAKSSVRNLTYVSTYEVFDTVDGIIRETHAIADESTMTPYFQSMIRAYRQVVAFAADNGVTLTTIHPAAVYGGLNTSGGITDYMENIYARNWRRVPFINPGRFPVIHVDSAADLLARSLSKPGAYIASDQMTTLKDIARTMRDYAPAYVPIVMPLWLIRSGITVLEAVSKVTGVRPIASQVQIEFLTKGWEPRAEKAVAELGWSPMTLAEGIRRYVSKKAQPATV